jgi:predicted extracellular nuclease/plastocyanin
MRSLNLLLAALFFGASLAGSAQCGLFFSEYAEGSSNNKYLEIYNPTNEAIDLSGFAYPSTSNAPTVPGEYEFWNAFDEGATIAAGGIYVIAHPSANAAILAFANETHQYLSNGDDGYALVQGTQDAFTILDVIGNWDADPGSGWDVAGESAATKDHTLVRKSTVTQGVGYDWATAAGTNAEDSQWIVYDQNTWDYLGSHDFTGNCGAAVPGCTNENASNYNADATEDDGSCTFDNSCNVDGIVVTTGGFYFSPQDLAIEPGTTVVWENVGGSHNANGTTNTLTGESFGNPEDFFFSPVSSSGEAVCIGNFTFTIPGVYSYDCSVGTHAALGMVGTVTVGTGGCTNAAAPNYNEAADFDDGSCLEVTTTAIATIQEGQLTDAYTGTTVVTNGVVTGVFGSLVSVQDGQGPYSGIWMFGPNVPVVVGDDIEITGTVAEYYGLTQLTGVSVVINAQGASLPTPEVLSTATAASDEQWEGVLVQVTGGVSSESLGYGEWGVDDTSGECRIDDRGYDAIGTGNVTAGSTWQVTGPLDYSFGNYKIQPRSEADALLYGCTSADASNYNAGAGIDDGSCEFSGESCGIFFSEYAEGSGNNKYLELYNPTTTAVFLSQFMLGNCSNGCDDPDAPFVSDQFDYLSFNFPFDAEIGPGETYIVAHPSADSVILALADVTHQYLSNGDDAYGLFELAGNDTVLVDIIGAIGPDPGSGWEVAGVANATKDHTLVRNEFVFTGNGGDWAMSAGTNALDSEWIVLDQNDWSDLGMHTFSGSCAASTGGCTDPFAVNYDENATSDDGSCIYIDNYTIQEIQSGGLSGQMQTQGIVTATYPPTGGLAGQASYVIQDGTGPNSAIWVIGDGVALGDEVSILGNVTEVYGLRQIQAATPEVLSSGNALPAAEMLATAAINDEQWECVLISMTGECTNADAGYGEWHLNDGSGIGTIDDIGYDAIGDSLTADGGNTYAPLLEEGRSYRVVGPNFYAYGAWKLLPRDAADVVRLGCTTASFSNYDPYAQEDDGSCVDAPGCTDPAADNYDPAATLDDGSCIISGCDDPAAFNYQEGVNNPTNEDCYYTLPNLVINEIHYNPCSAQGDDFDYEFVEIYNGGDMPAEIGGFEFYNTASGAPQLGYVFPEGTSIAAGEFVLMTVSDEGTANYSGLGVQIFQLELGNFSNSGEAVSIEDGFGNVIDAVTYDDADPWPAQTVAVLGNVLVQSPDGGCSTLELIQTDLNNEDPDNWQASWVDNGTPGAPNSSAFGCVDAAACNFASGAFFDDGSCTYDCYGCTYADATNYDAAATMENGTCEFDFTDPCPADVNEDGQVGTPDLLFFLSQFGSDCPE